jgi:hypothetical protein
MVIEPVEKSRPPLLIPEDYPKLFRQSGTLYTHPDDYKLSPAKPIEPTMLLYKPDQRTRMFLRTPILLEENCWTTATFFDTGACAHIFTSEELFRLLSIHRRVFRDELGQKYSETSVKG